VDVALLTQTPMGMACLIVLTSARTILRRFGLEFVVVERKRTTVMEMVLLTASINALKIRTKLCQESVGVVASRPIQTLMERQIAMTFAWATTIFAMQRREPWCHVLPYSVLILMGMVRLTAEICVLTILQERRQAHVVVQSWIGMSA
jgi:hypothetical protein